MSHRSMSAVAAMLAIVAFPTAGFAQAAASPVPAIVAPAPNTNQAPPPRATAAAVEQHIRHLHQQLAITPAEEPQWETFASVMRDNAAQMGQAFGDRGTKVGTMSAVENMQSFAQLATLHATDMQNLASAFQALYSSFPDQQKAVADNVFRQNNASRVQSKK